MTPQCRTARLRHRHEGSNIIKLKPTKTRGPDEKDVGGRAGRRLRQRKSQNKTEAAAKEKHTLYGKDRCFLKA